MALAKAKMAQRMYQVDSNVAGESRALIVVAQALQKEGSGDAAMQTLEDAANLCSTIGDEYGQAEAYQLMESYQNLSYQERQDFTKRVMARFDKQSSETTPGIYSYGAAGGGPGHFFLPPAQKVKGGPAFVHFHGFMGRAATVVAPKGSSSKGPS